LRVLDLKETAGSRKAEEAWKEARRTVIMVTDAGYIHITYTVKTKIS
jgi:hypothetical protein